MTPIDSMSSSEENEESEPDDPQLQPSADSSPLARACEGNGRSVQDAWRHLRADAASDAQLSENSSAERERQQAVITGLAGKPGWSVRDAETRELPLVSDDTSEHVVYRFSDRWLIKTTLAGWYGQNPVITDGKLRQVAATPAQYLDRIGLCNLVFNGEVKLAGFCVSDRPSLIIGEPLGQPSIVIAQRYYVAADSSRPAPSLEEISRFMRMIGFLSVRDSHYGWVRLADGVVVVDAKPDNFVLTSGGIIPIDLQIAQMDPEVLRGLVVS